MAIDYSGLLTGISKDPKAEAAKMLAQSAIAQNPNLYAGTQYAMGQAPRREAAMRQAAGGLLGRDLRSPVEKATQELQKLTTSPNFDISNPEQQNRLLELARVVNPAEAVKIAKGIKDRKISAGRRQSLITQAMRLNLDTTVELLKEGGDLKTAEKQVLEAEERNIVSKQGRKGRARVAEAKGVAKPMIDAILRGDYDNVSDSLFLEELSGEKADLKFFQQTDSEGTVSSVPFPVNAAGQVRNPKTEKWVYPDELGLTQAPVTTKQLSEANSFAQALTEGAAQNFLELSKKAQDAKEILRTNAESIALLDRDGGIKTGFGANFRLNVARVAKELGVVPESMDNIAATEQYLILRAEQLMKIMPAFGAGSGLSDSDREVASSIALREVSMDEAALRNLLRLEAKYARQTIIDNNKAVDRAIKIGKGGMSPELAQSFYIALPQREGYRTPPAAATYLNK